MGHGFHYNRLHICWSSQILKFWCHYCLGTYWALNRRNRCTTQMVDYFAWLRMRFKNAENWAWVGLSLGDQKILIIYALRCLSFLFGGNLVNTIIHISLDGFPAMCRSCLQLFVMKLEEFTSLEQVLQRARSRLNPMWKKEKRRERR